MRKFDLLCCLLIMSTVLFVACSDDDDEPKLPGDVKVVEFINATSYTDWQYFSFEKGGLVEVSDYANDLSWDIAFHRGDVRLNGGKSGKGQGEAINTNKTK